ncbi:MULTISPECIES: class I SAM-dependent methyltransferase [Okeania]|uniref:Class I SAM-dependent methyltransferase n=1 Tax=Okeania hirsuta TaxID=1458930 RepID=A0A3N6QYD5_9CYAN|nr:MULTISPECIES: class I SAM-dependent methyltransferase [Okeania]NES88430.1 class I SAM-dependent methyltransferase [Okeania sp. SIO2B9]RQH17857.1 class I SAM-dependent methyltransferase [Okeania hirsuta]RQH50927.1 class I SAM-dependent methyltransferase [Okeania hirsuta]
MTKEYRYKSKNPNHPYVKEYIHQITEGGTGFVWEEFQNKVLQNCQTIYDCGCGLGRLFHNLSHADVIVAAELDPPRFKHAVLKAKAIVEKNSELEAMLDQRGDKYDALLDEIDKKEYHFGNFHLFNNSMTEVEPLREYAPFDTIISGQVFPHVTFDLVQGALSAFYSLLKSEGILTIFTTKTKGEPLQHLKSKRDGSPLLKIGRKEFADVFKSEMGKVLPIRYYSFDLFKSILQNPFSESMKEIFAEEFATASSEVNPSFQIIDWVVYRGEQVNGFYEDYDRAQKLLGIQCPIQPRDFAKSEFDERTVKLLRSFAAWIESSINKYDWKEGLLTDMMILAKKAK